MNKEEFEQDIEVDPLQLDVQAALQGENFFKWAERSAKARKKVNDLELDLKIIKSELSDKLRRNPSKYGMDKATEVGIQNAIRLIPRYREANEALIAAKLESELLDVAVKAMEQKKRMIEVLITLHGQSYFAGPSVPRNLMEAWKEEKDKRGKKLVSRTKVRRREERE